LLLAVIFVVAAVAKLADRAGSRRAVTDFGVPAPLAGALGVLLPIVELGVAAALVPAATALWGAVGALVLLLLFIAGIGANLARGRRPECHCFGQLHSEPAGWKTLARNGALAAVAGFVVWRGYGGAGPSPLSWLVGLSALEVAGLVFGLLMLALIAAQWWFLLNLLRQNGRLLTRLRAVEETLGLGPTEGRPVGEAAPDFELPGLDGETTTLGSLRAAGKPVILLFTDPGCNPCTAMLPAVGRWQEEHAEKLTVALVSRGDIDDNAAKASEHGLTNVLVQEDWEVSDAYGVDGTPSAVLVQPDGSIGSPVRGGEYEIGELVASVVREPARLSP
jgi:methylamine dehydrogenase accessory protein MauD